MKGDQRPTILGLSIAFPIVSILAVLLRIKARRIKRAKLGGDDYTILIALVLTIGVTINVLLDSVLGDLGWHTQFTSKGAPLDTSAHRAHGKAAFALQILVWPCVGLQKISVLLFYKRIFVSRRFQIIVWCFIGFCVAWTTAFMFAVTFSCTPPRFHWEPKVKFHCINQIRLYTTALATDVVTDGLILLLPVYNVWKLQMRTPQKIVVTGLFLLGGFTTVTGIIRLHFLQYAYASLKQPTFNDVTYNYAPAFYWSIIETNAGILSACLPTLRPIFKDYPTSVSFTRLIKSFTGSFRSAISSHKEVRLNSLEHSMEKGLTDSDRQVLDMHQNRAYAIYDDSHSPPRSPTNIHYKSTYSVSGYPDLNRSSDDN
ncbi:MAG: hypothetical protein LQ351_004417 [Letrouitia transgressa]|nr:MAG: hypothetical protein LQ351_004417 [Letrouitia transgressa]